MWVGCFLEDWRDQAGSRWETLTSALPAGLQNLSRFLTLRSCDLYLQGSIVKFWGGRKTDENGQNYASSMMVCGGPGTQKANLLICVGNTGVRAEVCLAGMRGRECGSSPDVPAQPV